MRAAGLAQSKSMQSHLLLSSLVKTQIYLSFYPCLPWHSSCFTFDIGPNFLESIVKKVCDIRNTRRQLTSAYHSQTDGLVKRINVTQAEGLCMYMSANQKDWDQHTPMVLFAYRVFPSATTVESPFYLCMDKSHVCLLIQHWFCRIQSFQPLLQKFTQTLSIISNMLRRPSNPIQSFHSRKLKRINAVRQRVSFRWPGISQEIEEHLASLSYSTCIERC